MVPSFNKIILTLSSSGFCPFRHVVIATVNRIFLKVSPKNIGLASSKLSRLP